MLNISPGAVAAHAPAAVARADLADLRRRRPVGRSTVYRFDRYVNEKDKRSTPTRIRRRYRDLRRVTCRLIMSTLK
ncbi:hypothetical protein EVAR_21062_1 [Eumeta japonica]|uniref:Uncharacterized protein n=1 Tax=Eumeta variegata TaxID=151549 RepID=A0A4C1UZW8_EUMVA|nr:hypothetical protein EVAR_21062_1 [Eumeta japonica]